MNNFLAKMHVFSNEQSSNVTWRFSILVAQMCCGEVALHVIKKHNSTLTYWLGSIEVDIPRSSIVGSFLT